MNKKSNIKKISLLSILFILILTFSSVSYCAWWGDPGYVYALKQGFTSPTSRYQLAQEVELDDLYRTITSYLDSKYISPKTRKIHRSNDISELDGVAAGIVDIIDSYTSREKLTMNQYYIVEKYCRDGYELLKKYGYDSEGKGQNLSLSLNREDMKNLRSYFDLSMYRAAVLQEKQSDKQYALSRVGYVKNSRIVHYNMMPYSSKITRKEFMLLMYDLLSENELSDDQIIQAFLNTEILKGYDARILELELNKVLTYQEMYTFLYRFDSYDFAQNKLLEDME